MLIYLIAINLLSITFQNPPYYPISGKFDSVCHTYQCGISPTKQNAEITGCMVREQNTIYLKQCEPDWYCSGDQSDKNSSDYGECLLKKPQSKYQKLENEFCYQNFDCKTSYCLSNKCATKGFDASCTSSAQCGIEMLCDQYTKKCVKWLQAGESCEGKPLLCYPGSRCLYVNSSQAICVQFFSQRATKLKIYGQTTSSLNSSTDYVLFQDIFFNDSSLSVYCASGFYNPSTDACYSGDPLTSKQGFPYQCGSYSDCISNEFSNIYSACDCTYAATSGKKHCLGFHGDNKLKSHFERIKNTMQKSFTGCKYWEVIWGRGNCGLWQENWDWQGVLDSEVATCSNIVGNGRWDFQENDANECPKIVCSSNNEEGLCAQYDDNKHIFYLSECRDGYGCGEESDLNDSRVMSLSNIELVDKYGIYGKNVSCTKPIYGKRVKGEGCWVDNDCFSGRCSNSKKVCEAVEEYGKCTSHSECDQGLLCDNDYNQCVQWIIPYQNCSISNSSQCRPGSLCITFDSNFATDSETTGTCLPYYSIPANTPYYIITSTYIYTGELDFMCEQGAFNPKLGVCSEKPRNSSEFPKSCELDSTCDSQIGGDGECICFPNSKGKQYCRGFDVDYKADIFDILREYYKRDLNQCFYYQIGTVNGEFGWCSMDLSIPNIYQLAVPKSEIDWCTEDVLYAAYYYEQSLLQSIKICNIIGLMFFALIVLSY